MSDAKQPLLQTVEVETGPNAAASIIWMHGLGADGHDFEPIVPELQLPDALPVRFIFPHAPQREVSINAGMQMRAWFDIKGLGVDVTEDAVGIAESAAAIHALMQQERDRGMAAERIVLAGFSQGGAMALHVGLRYADKLAGVMALSTWLPLRTHFAQEAAPANADTGIFMAHGSYDPMVPCKFGEYSRDMLQQQGYQVNWRAYPMQHQLCLEEIADIGRWLREMLG